MEGAAMTPCGPFPFRIAGQQYRFCRNGTTTRGKSGSWKLDGAVLNGLDSLGFGLALVTGALELGTGSAGKQDEQPDKKSDHSV
jgi:hypothetical protein